LRSSALFLLPIVVAAALRFPALASRPMHADEAIHADKLGTLLEGGGYAYDPAQYHGPTLYYLTLPVAWARGERTYAAIDETTLRVVPAALGVLLVAAHLAASRFLGLAAAAVAALLAAISPAMVFYSRYYIHEVPLVLFSFGALLAAWRYLEAPGSVPAVLGGLFAGLAFATKETAVLALGALALAGTLVVAFERPSERPRFRGAGRHLAFAVLAALIVVSVLFSAFFRHTSGIGDFLRAYRAYSARAIGGEGHVHPWSYYLGLLAHFEAPGAPFWTEGIVLALALVGGIAAWTGAGPAGMDRRAVRVLALSTVFTIVLYAAIPYKTPWCLLGFLHAMILLAGVGAIVVFRSARSHAARIAVSALLLVAAAHLGWQAFAASFRFASDPRNPYVYAHTGTDVYDIVGRVKDLAKAHPDRLGMPIQVISRTNLWPLPFYLRGFRRVQWWTGVSDEAPVAPVVLLTPDMEPALVHRLYDVPPPGERELYVSAFERPLELRPEVELRGYAARGLWEDFRRIEAEASSAASGPPR
jgi:uncharacterized protein (TIGR03663 family)